MLYVCESRICCLLSPMAELPTLSREGRLTFRDGAVFYPVELSPAGKSIDELAEKLWAETQAKIEHVCKSGACQHAHKPKCNCHCDGLGHRAAMRRDGYSLDEFLPHD